MRKSKRSEPQGQDRLSELPDSVIFLIFRSVPMSDVIKTAVLSKRWRNLWTTLPFLNFDKSTLSHRSPIVKHDPRTFRSFVNQFLFRWNGSRIMKFRVYYDFNEIIGSEIELWVKFAVEKGVEELCLNNTEYSTIYNSEVEKCWVPQCLYSCSSIKVITIAKFKFRINENVQWNKLRNLTIYLGYEVSEHVINQIMSGSPRLETFDFTFVDEEQNLNIRSKSLKVLSICKYVLRPQDVSLVSELTISAPNLETLIIEGVPFGKCRLINVSSSTFVTIGFSGSLYLSDMYDRFSEIHLENGLSFQDFLGEEFFQILQTIQHVESVALVCCCPEVLGALKMKRCIYPNVKSLKFNSLFDDYEQFVGLLEVFPRLSELVLTGCLGCYFKKREPPKSDARSFLKFEANLPKSLLLQLKTVDITWFGRDDIFPLIEFLLKYASKLEEVVFKLYDSVGRFSSSSKALLLQASHKLLRMPRSSPSCRICLGLCNSSLSFTSFDYFADDTIMV